MLENYLELMLVFGCRFRGYCFNVFIMSKDVKYWFPIWPVAVLVRNNK